MLAIQSLSLSRGKTRLVAALSHDLAAGDVWLLRGANGSGKTTLLRAVAGLLHPDAGDVRWQGEDVRDCPAYRAAMAWCPHQVPWRDELSAQENVQSLLLLIGQVAGRTELMAALERCGIATRRNVAARRLSQGQRRRLLLAWLLLARKSVWLMDEPQNALDDEGSALFDSMIADHQAGGGIAVIATHRDIVHPQLTTTTLAMGAAPSLSIPEARQA
jgi:heme exporter protein A